jgi:DNA polymerase-1
MTTLVADVEANGLLDTITTVHCAGCIDADTGEEFFYRPHQIQEFLDKLDSADKIVFHNAFGYDLPALEKVYGWKPRAKGICTKVMSQVLCYTRFGFGHNLKQWGEYFEKKRKEELKAQRAKGNTTQADCQKMAVEKESLLKGDYTGGWEEFNEDMFEYMKQDIRLGTRVYKELLRETKVAIKHFGSKSILGALRSEMEMDRIMVKQCQNGWLFDKEAAEALMKTLEERMNSHEIYINGLLGQMVSSPDGSVVKARKEIADGIPTEIPSKSPKFTKAGKLDSHTKRWFGIPADSNLGIDTPRELPVDGPYCRIEFVGGDVGNTNTVKEYLYTIGWKPDEWNWKKIDGQFVKVSAKLSDSSLAPLGRVGEVLSEYYTLRSRYSVMKGWFPHIDENSRLHGDVFNVGTPTFRQTHKIIANLPSGKAVLGPEIRKLFIARPGYKLVSADSAGCQLRLLAHFMGDDNYTREVLEGDIHQKNADILGCSRNDAKPFIFAYLYGAGGKKLGSILGVSDREGNKLKKKFTAAFPALGSLIDKVKNIVDQQGFIPGLDDRPIYTESQHKALNYLIQGAEAVVMKYTIIMIEEELAKAGLDQSILLFYHDEVTYEVREDQAEQAREIIMRCFEEAPKALGVDIMTCGDCNIGGDYFEVH